MSEPQLAESPAATRGLALQEHYIAGAFRPSVSGATFESLNPATNDVLVRAAGPSLAQFGVTDALTNPQLTVYQNGSVIATNSAWASAVGAPTRVSAAAWSFGSGRRRSRYTEFVPFRP